MMASGVCPCERFERGRSKNQEHSIMTKTERSRERNSYSTSREIGASGVTSGIEDTGDTYDAPDSRTMEVSTTVNSCLVEEGLRDMRRRLVGSGELPGDSPFPFSSSSSRAVTARGRARRTNVNLLCPCGVSLSPGLTRRCGKS